MREVHVFKASHRLIHLAKAEDMRSGRRQRITSLALAKSCKLGKLAKRLPTRISLSLMPRSAQLPGKGSGVSQTDSKPVQSKGPEIFGVQGLPVQWQFCFLAMCVPCRHDPTCANRNAPREQVLPSNPGNLGAPAWIGRTHVHTLSKERFGASLSMFCLANPHQILLTCQPHAQSHAGKTQSFQNPPAR